jgi:hypothetical protein
MYPNRARVTCPYLWMGTFRKAMRVTEALANEVLLLYNNHIESTQNIAIQSYVASDISIEYMPMFDNNLTELSNIKKLLSLGRGGRAIKW